MLNRPRVAINTSPIALSMNTVLGRFRSRMLPPGASGINVSIDCLGFGDYVSRVTFHPATSRNFAHGELFSKPEAKAVHSNQQNVGLPLSVWQISLSNSLFQSMEASMYVKKSDLQRSLVVRHPWKIVSQDMPRSAKKGVLPLPSAILLQCVDHWREG